MSEKGIVPKKRIITCSRFLCAPFNNKKKQTEKNAKLKWA